MLDRPLSHFTNNQYSPELAQVKINYYPITNTLEITTPYLFSAQLSGELLYLLYQRFNYCWHYLNYQIKVIRCQNSLNSKFIQGYLKLIHNSPFLWKDFNNFAFFLCQSNILEQFIYQSSTLYLFLPVVANLSEWKKQVFSLKEILINLGLTTIRLALRRNDYLEENDKINSSNSNNKIYQNKQAKELAANQEKLNRNSLLRTWQNQKIFELGVHTKFSTLDGISSPADYLTSAQQKNYAALAVTDHYNVQSFPEFSKSQKGDLKVIYGCELEMLEDNLPPYIFNHSADILTKKISDLTYCIFDLETTGFFSSYNEIIELGYAVYHQGKIIREGNYLIRPEREIAPEVLASWYTSIDPHELQKAPKIKEILPILQKDWQDCVLVAHNARNFDYGFLNKVWEKNLGFALPYSVIDTLPLSWILFPERKSYSLEKLSRGSGRNKIIQTHRALDDSKLLVDLLERLMNELNEKGIKSWSEVEKLINNNYFPNRGYKIKVLATNQEGLYNLYRLITISHTQRLFKTPCVLRSDLVKYRSGLMIGAAGGRGGEIFALFSSFNFTNKRKEALCFYDYLEVNSPETFRYLWLNGRLREEELKEMIKLIINTAEQLNIPFIASHNVHYCENKEKLLKEIIVANEGMNGIRHYLYNEATLEEKEDRFASLPTQHLLNKEEMIDNWLFLNEKNLLEKILFYHPHQLVKKIGKVNIQPSPLNYSDAVTTQEKEHDLVTAYTRRANEIFGEQWPKFVQERLTQEWQIIKERYVFIYWLAYKVVKKTHQDGFLVGSRGSVGSSFIAYLCGITDLNPLPFYKFCYQCHYTELYTTKEPTYSCYDYQDQERCPHCSNKLTMEGHNLPPETFFGLKGEKTPDIDLNFSGEYQKIIHNYVRKLLGEKSVYRIGTINTLSQQTAEIFWREHLTLRQKLNSAENINSLINSETAASWQKKYWENLQIKRKDFQEEEWYKEWIEKTQIKDLEKQLAFSRRNKDEKKSKEIWEMIKQVKQKSKEEMLEELKGIKRTTGQHPGGLLITLPNTDIHHYTPLNYPADNRQSEWTTTHFEYSFLSEIFLKVDILGHDEPTVLQKLFQLTGKDLMAISFTDKKIMKLFTEADTLGIPEFGTDFVRRNLLLPLHPTKFSQLIQISGFSHGTNVWTQNQHSIYKNKQLKLSQLIACREDIWNFLVIWGVEKKKAFIATEYIRKGKWEKLTENIKQELKSKLSDKEGELYFDILSKIKYIFPKPHAIAYTMTAWRVAFYKLYYPQQFYSVLLTYHATVYDIWLMTLDSNAINFRLESLLNSLPSYKSNAKELLSIIKVLEELNKEKKRLKKSEKSVSKIWEKIDIDKILVNIQEKINNLGDKKLITGLKQNGRVWKLTAKEKDLLFTLKVIGEMEDKGLKFKRGIDLNHSEIKDFKIENNVIYFPFTAITGIGEKVAAKIIAYRQEKGSISANWREELAGLLNINNIQQLVDLEKYNILIDLNI